MEFIIGGAYQGKLLYCLEKYKCRKEDIFFAGNGVLNTNKSIICGFNLLVRDFINNGINAESETEKLLNNKNIIAVISDEIGNGIVPIDAFERKWREETGRCCCIVAKRADTVTRIYSGIPMVIK